MYRVNLIDCDTGEMVASYTSQRPMAPTLRLAWEMLDGMPSCEVCIRRGGDVVAWLHTDWRGQLDEVEIHVHHRPAPGVNYGCVTVTDMNPKGPLFSEVSA